MENKSIANFTDATWFVSKIEHLMMEKIYL